MRFALLSDVFSTEVSLDRPFDFQMNYDWATISTEFHAQFQIAFPASKARQITKGLEIARKAHLGQVRSDGGPYIVHPVRSALLAMRYDSLCTAEIVIAGMLRDTLEDTELTENGHRVRIGAGRYGIRRCCYAVSTSSGDSEAKVRK